ncbi:MAG: hypothetical protein LBU73_05575 [Helicobacteraceae bacterium]|jgi:HPt (histidine-containing phosphotransfer) domain-containing protein|nr:hypothetical protein [Helicobacteraceae bacterium]
MNKEAIAEENGMDIEDVEAMIVLFKQNAEAQRSKIKEAIDAGGDEEIFIQSFHKLAGSSAKLLGLGEINEIARQTELAIHNHTPYDPKKSLSAIEDILRKENLIA